MLTDTASPATNADAPAPNATTTMDRAHWQPALVGPKDGRTSHNPVYLKDADCFLHRNVPPRANMSFDDRITTALDQDEPAGFDRKNVLGFFANIFKPVADLFLAPVQIVTGNPPWANITTPDTEPLDPTHFE